MIRGSEVPLIRALTLTIPDCRNLRERINMLKYVADRVERQGIKVWSLRVSVPWPCREALRIAMSECDILFTFSHGDLSKSSITNIEESLRLPNTYASAVVKGRREVEVAVRVLRELRDKLGLNALTRFAYSINKVVLTPYFPLSTPLSYGVSAALRYADLLTNESVDEWVDLLSNYLTLVDSVVRSALAEAGLPYLGIDASLSPWMRESVVNVINKVLRDVELPMPGSAFGVAYVNKVIAEAIRRSGIKTVGFNELMMPVAEDNVLKKLVFNGNLRLRDLIWLSGHCVAGVDMVAVPSSNSLLKGLIHDLIETQILKGGSLGVRVIPVSNSRKVINLELFGELPVIKP